MASPTTGGGTDGTVAPKKSNRPIIFTAIGVITALIAGAGIWFFAVRDASATGGADDPQTAVQGLLTAISAGDVLGALEMLPPGEKELFVSVTKTALSESTRLGLLDPSVSLNKVSGGSISFDNLEYGEVKSISDTISYVPIRGGSVTVTGDLTQVPFTQQIADLIVGEVRELDGEATVDIEDINDRFDIKGLPLTAVLVDGKWYPSLFYTSAEFLRQVRLDKDGKLNGQLTPKGAASPEEVFSELLEAAADRRLTDMIELVDPTEGAVLYDYAGPPLRALEDDLEEALAYNGDDYSAEVTDSAYTVGEEIDDIVQVRADLIEVEIETSYSSARFVLEFNDGCNELSVDTGGDDDSLEVCVEDWRDAIEGDVDYDEPFYFLAITPAIATVEVNGRWYLKPSASVLNAVLPLLAQVTAEDVSDLINEHN